MKCHAHPTVQSCHGTVGGNERWPEGASLRVRTVPTSQCMFQLLKLFVFFLCSVRCREQALEFASCKRDTGAAHDSPSSHFEQRGCELNKTAKHICISQMA